MEIAIYISHRKKIFENFKFFKIFKYLFLKWSLGMKRGCHKRLNAKLQLNTIISYFVLFFIPEDIAIYVTGRNFSNFTNFSSIFFSAKWSLGMKRGCKKRLNAKFQLNPITSIPEEIALYVTGKKFSNFSKFSNIFFFFLQNGVWE